MRRIYGAKRDEIIGEWIKIQNTGSSKKMDGIWNRCNVKSTRRIYTFDFLKCSEILKFQTYLSTFHSVHRL